MATQHKEDVPSPDSSETDVPGATGELSEKLSKDHNLKDEDDYDNLNYPPAWKFEKWFVGGYNQSRMLKFKKPKTMYTAINLFAGKSTEPALPQNSDYIDCLARCGYHVLRL